MRSIHRSCARGCVLLSYLIASYLLALPEAQGQQATGFPNFGSFGGQTDMIDYANQNIHFQIPIFSRAGRGIPFSYALSYDSLIWTPVTSGSTKSWAYDPNWGWGSVTQAQVGYIAYSRKTVNCDSSGTRSGTYFVWNSFSYVDGQGTAHSFGTEVGTNPTNCGSGEPATDSDIAFDGTGYSLTVTVQGSTIVTDLRSRSGMKIGAPLARAGSGTVTDTNGNQVKAVVNSATSTSFYDTLGTAPVLTVADTLSGSTLASRSYSYTNPSSGSTSYVVNYVNRSIKTNFQCAGVTEAVLTAPLVDNITLPDGSKYLFTYEATPSYSGYVTGRLLSVTIPTGGTYTYGYYGGSGGINCADGTGVQTNRSAPDGNWFYVKSGSTTTITDPQNNQTVLTFAGTYETKRMIYQGSSATGTLLQQVDTCYNSSCNATAPITQVKVTTTLPGTTALVAKTVTNYNSYGLPTEVDQYDFGGSTNPIKKKVITYNTSLTNNILDRPSSVQSYNSAGSLLRQTSYAYDETAVTQGNATTQFVAVSGSRGNVTTITDGRPGNVLLARTYTYLDNGNVNQSMDVNGTTTGHVYGNCGNSLLNNTSVSVTSGLDSSNHSSARYLYTGQTWDCTGGVVTSSVDRSSQTWTSEYKDSMWRVTKTTDPTNVATTYSYTAGSTNTPALVESTLNFNGTTSTQDTLIALDKIGRSLIVQRKQSQGSTLYDSVETDYDPVTGQVNRTTVPYTIYAGDVNSNTSATAKQVTFDALGRPLSVSEPNGAGVTTTYSYSQNDVLISVGPAPTGENLKQRQLEYDALGRLTSVCEITTGAGSGSCGQTNAKTGYWTKYVYDGIDNLQSVVQNAQSSTTESRSYNYDALKRLVSETNPETGTTSYFYDSDTTCGITSKGDLIRRVDQAANVTCYAYDELHRNTAVTYPSGPFAAKSLEKHYVYDSAYFTFGTTTYSGGRLAEAYTGPVGSKSTDLGFYYTARGEVNNTFELTPHSGGYYQIAASYWDNGLMSGMGTNLGGIPNWNFYPDGEGRLASITGSSYQSPLTATTYDGIGPTGITFGSGDSDSFSYDQYTGRQKSYAFKVNGSTETGTLTWNGNGSLQKLVISDPFSSANNQTCTNGYDDLARLVSNNCGTTWSNSFSYDAFGNMKKSGSSSFVPTYNTANQYAALPSGTPSYASNGVVNNDGLHSYLWDSEGKNVQLDASLTMTYDALGRWVERNNNGSYSQAVYGPDGSEVAVMSGSSVISYYLNLPGGAKAVYNTSGLTGYWHPDWLGTPRLYTSTTHTILADTAIGAYGEQYQGISIDTMYTGVGQIVEANDLRTFPARNLSTVEGRWISPDPAGLSAVDLGNPQSLNRYAYVVGNPFGLVDPTGTTDCDPWSGCQYYGRNDGGYGGSDGYSGVTQGDCFSASSSVPCGGFPGGGISLPLPGSGPGGGTVGQPNLPVLAPPASTASPSAPIVNVPRESNLPGQTCEVSVCGSDFADKSGQTSGAVSVSGFLNVYWFVGIAGTFSYDPSQHVLCGGVGVGLGAGHNLSGGPVVVQAKAGNTAKDVLGGWSVSGGYNWNIFRGVQGSVNGSGGTGGSALGVPGASGTVTYSWCRVGSTK